MTKKAKASNKDGDQQPAPAAAPAAAAAVSQTQEPTHAPGLCGEASCPICAPQVAAVWEHAQQHLLAIPGVTEVVEAHQVLSQEIDLAQSPTLQRLMNAL